MDNTRPIICDTGTGYLKIGWAGDNFPAHTFPTMVGRPMLRFDEKIEGVELKVYYQQNVLFSDCHRVSWSVMKQHH